MVEVAQYVVKYNLAGPVPGRSYRGLKHPHLEDLGWRTSLSCSPGDTPSSHILPPPALKCEWCRICTAGTHSHVEQKMNVVGGTGRNLEMNLFMEFLNRAYTVSSKTSRGQPTETFPWGGWGRPICGWVQPGPPCTRTLILWTPAPALGGLDDTTRHDQVLWWNHVTVP